MDADQIRDALSALRQRDLPTHGGRTLAYVYDSGLAEADALGREALAAFGATNGLDPTAFPSLQRMEQDLVGHGRRPARRSAGDRRHGHLGRHRVDPAGRPVGPRRPPGDRPADHGAARPRPTPRSTRRRTTSASGRDRRRRPGDRPGRGRGDGGRDHRRHRAGRRLGPVVRPRRDRPGHPDRHRRPGPRRPLPRRRLHRRLAAALPAPRRPRAAGVLLPDPRGDQHLGRSAQVRATPRRASRSCCTATPPCAGRSTSPAPAGRATP